MSHPDDDTAGGVPPVIPEGPAPPDDTTARLRALVAKWRATSGAVWLSGRSAVGALRSCADDVEAALAAAGVADRDAEIREAESGGGR